MNEHETNSNINFKVPIESSRELDNKLYNQCSYPF